MSGTTDILGRPTKDHNPAEDIKFLEEELNKWYYNLFLKVWKAFSRKIDAEKLKFSENVAKQFSGLKVKEKEVKEVLRKFDFPERISIWGEKELKLFSSKLREISKPMIIAANKMDLKNGFENYEKLKKEFPSAKIIPCSADSELALRTAAKNNLIKYIPGERDFKILKQLNEKQEIVLKKIKKEVLDKFEDGTGIQAVLNYAIFVLAKYIAIFPASANKLADSKGNILPDCFLLPEGSTALDFAYYLHTDFGKNFIKAIDARTKRALGKNYILKNRDALEIIIR